MKNIKHIILGIVMLSMVAVFTGCPSTSTEGKPKPKPKPKQKPVSILINPKADQGIDGWKPFSSSGVVNLNNDRGIVFYTHNMSKYQANIHQDVAITPDKAGKFLLMIGYTSMDNITTEGLPTRHPYLHGYQITDKGYILMYMQDPTMYHTKDPGVWQTVSGIYEIKEGTATLRFFLMKEFKKGQLPDKSRALFDDLELIIFDTRADAEAYVNQYKETHP